MMRDTVHAIVNNNQVNQELVADSIYKMVEKVQSYVPGYKLRTEPIFEDNKITVFLEIEGAGHYLPKYAGNLDIMTSAAVKVAEEFAKHRMETIV